jgi:hypothetical protein
MSLRGWAPGKEISSLRGLWSSVAQKAAGAPARASYCQNVRFAPGIVRTRPGTGLVPALSPSAGNKARGLSVGNLGAGWLFFYLLGKELRYGGLSLSSLYCPAPLDYTNPIDPQFPSLPMFKDVVSPVAPYSITVAYFNNFAYIAVADKNGNGLAPAVISDGSAVVDVAFSSFTLYRSGLGFGGGFALTLTSLGAGRCTPGTPSYALVLQTSTGFLSKPLIQTGTNFATASIIQATITIPAGSSIRGTGTIYLLKNRVDNPNVWYWIPNDPISGTVGEVPYQNTTGGPVTFTFTINLSDADMAASLDSANDQWLVMQQATYPTLTGPIKPDFVALYGKRMCYGVGNNLYVSDLENPQSLTPDRNIVQSPKQLKLGYVFPLPGSADLYLTGDRWLARVTDNGDTPSTWAPPIIISETIGAPLPGCVCYRTAGGYAWLATDAGVFLFTGQLGDKPVTYMAQDQWARVNWGAAYCIDMEDDIENRVLYITVPLDGATEANAVFVIDYTRGLSAEEVDISLDLYGGSYGVYSIAAAPDNQGNGRIWFGSESGHLLVQDAAATADSGTPITTIWESGLLRGAGDFASRMVRVGGMDLWIRGSGALTTMLYNIDKTRSINPPLLLAAGSLSSLVAAPGFMYQHKFDFSKVENYNVRFSTSGWFELSGFTVYSRPDLYNR